MQLLAYRLGKPGILYIIFDVHCVILDYKNARLSLGRNTGWLWRAELSLGRQDSLGCEAGLLFQDSISLIRLLPSSLLWAKRAKHHRLSGYLTKVKVFTFFLVYLFYFFFFFTYKWHTLLPRQKVLQPTPPSGHKAGLCARGALDMTRFPSHPAPFAAVHPLCSASLRFRGFSGLLLIPVGNCTNVTQKITWWGTAEFYTSISMEPFIGLEDQNVILCLTFSWM